MLIKKGNIWNYHLEGNLIVIPTNIGWKKNGENVMGRGLAKEAANMYPELPKVYGEFCRKEESNYNHRDTILIYKGMIMFPVKPLNHEFPSMSWHSEASLDTIERSCKIIRSIKAPIYLPLVGCGNGRLRREDVLPILEKILSTDNFCLVEKEDE